MSATSVDQVPPAGRGARPPALSLSLCPAPSLPPAGEGGGRAATCAFRRRRGGAVRGLLLPVLLPSLLPSPPPWGAAVHRAGMAGPFPARPPLFITADPRRALRLPPAALGPGAAGPAPARGPLCVTSPGRPFPAGPPGSRSWLWERPAPSPLPARPQLPRAPRHRILSLPPFALLAHLRASACSFPPASASSSSSQFFSPRCSALFFFLTWSFTELRICYFFTFARPLLVFLSGWELFRLDLCFVCGFLPLPKSFSPAVSCLLLFSLCAFNVLFLLSLCMLSGFL